MSNLDRLTADRRTHQPYLHHPRQVSLQRSTSTAHAAGRTAGQDAAANDLTWSHVAALCGLLPLAREAALHWTGNWGTERLRGVAGDTVADAHTFATFAAWAAWLEGVNDVAADIEGVA